MKVNAEDWGEFRIADLFEVKKGTRLTRADMIEGSTPFVGACITNNGVNMHVGNTEHVHPGNVISVAYNGAVATGRAFYQPEPFWASDDVAVLYPRFELNPLRALFFIPLIESAGKRYAFENKWKKGDMEQAVIEVPVSDGTPDWQWIDSYEAEIELVARRSLLRWRNPSVADSKPIDTGQWRLFIIGELFEKLKSGYVGEGRKIGSAEKHPDELHTVPLTCAKLGNQGIMYWGRPNDFITYDNVIAVIKDGAKSTGMVYAEEDSTGVYSHSYFIRVKDVDISFNVNLFLSRVLENTIFPKYTRDDTCTWEKISKETILLPVTNDGLPDWGYMDAYMSEIRKSAVSRLSALVKTTGKHSYSS